MIIDKATLSAKLNKLKSVVPGKSCTIPALQGVLFSDNTLAAYNLEIAIRTTIDTDTSESFIIPASALDLIPKLPDGEIEIIEQNNQLTINASGIKSKHSTLPVSEYPSLPVVKTQTKNTINGAELEKTLTKIIYAVAADIGRPILTGVLFQTEEEDLNIVATDAHRLAWAKIKYNEPADYVVPKLAIQKLLSIGLAETVEIHHTNNLALFITGEYNIITRLLEGQYVDYKRVLPNHNNTFKANRKQLQEAVERSLLAINQEKLSTNSIMLEIEADQMKLTTKSSVSEYVEYITLSEAAKQSAQIAFNPKYLLESIKSFDDEIIFYIGTSQQPMLLQHENLNSLLLPVRTGR